MLRRPLRIAANTVSDVDLVMFTKSCMFPILLIVLTMEFLNALLG